jgi:hypothetical protein
MNARLLGKIKADMKVNQEDMLAKMETNWERREAKTDANLKEIKEEMKSQIGFLSPGWMSTKPRQKLTMSR